jgi:hypothetical protein
MNAQDSIIDSFKTREMKSITNKMRMNSLLLKLICAKLIIIKCKII